jgi:3-deoxy-manno-octulosonate cytidylyltransferase (CMP-KDO synthetase)
VSGFTVLIPARMASTRLPGKPLADIAGLPMVVRVARQAAASGAQQLVVCADDRRIVAACTEHGVRAILTRDDHPTGTDRLSEAVSQLGLEDAQIVVNVQGDEPLLPPAVVAQVARALEAAPDCDLATAAHGLHDAGEFRDPNVVKVLTDVHGRALIFTRAPVPWPRDAWAPSAADARAVAAGTAAAGAGSAGASGAEQLPAGMTARRHIGLYAYRAGFLRRFPLLERPTMEQLESLEQLRALHHGHRIRVIDFDQPLPPGVDTPADLERVRALIGAHAAQHGPG